MARLGVERDCVGRMAGLLRQAAAGALAAAMVSQAVRASAVYMSAGPPPMYTHTANISSSSARVAPSFCSALT